VRGGRLPVGLALHAPTDRETISAKRERNTE
jgi:hypothetical protein